jgi:O-antigen/teichoic acid export membrane protein/acyl carrier protein
VRSHEISDGRVSVSGDRERGRLSALYIQLRQDHMMRNSLYLMLSAGLQFASGFTFWIVVAHLFSASDVGKASTLIAATNVIGYLALLGLNNAMGKYLPTSCNRDALISSGLAIVAICAAAVALAYIGLIPVIAPRLAFIAKSPALTVGFALLTATAAVNLLTDSIFVASRKAKYTVFVDGIVEGFGKIALAVALVGTGVYGIYSASVMGTALGAGASLFLIFTIMHCRLSLRKPLSTLRPLLRFSGANYVGNVFNMLPSLIVPVIVLDRLGAEAAAYFFVVFQVSGIVYVAALALEQTFLAEGSRPNADMRRLKRRSLGILVMLCAPAALGLIAVGRWVLLAFGWRYYHYGFPSLIIMALAAGPTAATYWLLTVLRLEGKLNSIVIVNVTYAAGICTLVWLASSHGLTTVAVAWFVGALIAACVAGAAMHREKNPRHLRPPRAPQLSNSVHQRSLEVTQLEEVIKNYISRELVQDSSLLPLRNATPLLETGILDSLSLLRLVVFIQEKFGFVVDDRDLVPEHFGSVDAICAHVRSRAGERIGQASGRG